MPVTLPYAFRGEIPTPTPKKQPKKRFFRSLFQHPISAWLLWMIIGAILYDFVIKGIGLLAISTASPPLLAFVGVISIAACGELATWLHHGKIPLSLTLRLGAGALLAMLVSLLF
ncbi:hypothetical protein OR573_04930 [Halomonas sp. CH40]